jgi:hypothetical protein
LGLVLGASGAAVPACSFAFDADTKQCSVDQDCTDKGFEKAQCVQELCQRLAADPIWGCLDEPPLVPTSNAVPIQLEVLNANNRTPRTDAFVRVCSAFDSLCRDSIGEPVQVDVAGKANLQVAGNFNGFLQVYGPQGPDVDDPDFVRLMVYLPTREILRGAQGRGVLVFNTELIKTLAVLGGGTFESNSSEVGGPKSDNGLILLTTLNCSEPSTTAAGVSYQLLGDQRIEGKTSGFYTVGQAGQNLPSTVNTETDGGGAGGFTNVKEGLALVTAKLNPLSRFISKESGTAVFVRAGWYTQVYVAP